MTTGFGPFVPLLLCVLGLAALGILLGVRLARVPELSRRILPFSGGVLLSVALFWIVPDVAAASNWSTAIAGGCAGFGVLWTIDRYVHAVCPSCSHEHNHEGCTTRLHGFAAPLLIASGLHSFFDGWSLAAAQENGLHDLRTAVVVGIGIHKLPEALAMGVLMLAAVDSAWVAALGAFAAQIMMIAGGVLAVMLAAQLGTNWTIVFLALAAGVFVYLGYHAIDGESRRRGIAPTLMPALTGAAGAAALKSLLPG